MICVNSMQNFAKPMVIGAGEDVIGDGPCGNDPRGPILRFAGTDDGVVFNGFSSPYRGTGGSVQDLKIIRQFGFSGGDGLKLTALDAAQRCGETLIRRVKIFGESALSNGPLASWNRGFVVDGSMLTVSGAAGIRRVTVDDLRIAGCTGDFIFLNNAVHFVGHAIQLDPGGSPQATLRIRDGQNIFLTSAVVNGDVIVEGNAKYVTLHGYMDTVRVGKSVAGVVIDGHVRNLIVEPGAQGRCQAMVANPVRNESTSFKVL